VPDYLSIDVCRPISISEPAGLTCVAQSQLTAAS